jgi:hypothetical protein
MDDGIKRQNAKRFDNNEFGKRFATNTRLTYIYAKYRVKLFFKRFRLRR